MRRFRRPRSARERGSTFTFIVIAVSVVIMLSATLLTDAVQNTFDLAALQHRQTRAREAAFASLRWAEREARAEPQRATGAGTLLLDGVRVELSYRLDGLGEARRLEVRAVAQEQEQAIELVATLAPVGEGFLLEGYTETIRSGPR